MLIKQREHGDCWQFDVSLTIDSDWHWNSHNILTQISPDLQVNRMKCDVVLWGCGIEWLEQVMGFWRSLLTWPFMLPSFQAQNCLRTRINTDEALNQMIPEYGQLAWDGQPLCRVGAICSCSVVTKGTAALYLTRLIEILETMGGLL
jgi:hypothetical protein